MGDQPQKRVIIIGAGLVGCLNAVFMGKRGYKVDLYELRRDMRKQEKVYGRSINLTLATRGREALRAAGVLDVMTQNGIPLFGRVVHDVKGQSKQVYYGKEDEHTTSLDRRRVNEILITAADDTPGVDLHFNHKMMSCDFDKGVATFITTDGKEVVMETDLIIGADGAHSTVRHQLMKTMPLTFRQDYHTHGYMELRMVPKNRTNSFNAHASTFLHIWPRWKFLLLSIPDFEEQCYVSTLTMTFDMFAQIKTEKQLIDFFNEQFPDFLEFLGVDEQDLIDTYFSRDPLPLIAVKCEPYHYKDKAVFMGDAAHAMYPFYGQGMNSGFEDCWKFSELLDKHKDNVGKALEEFSETRKPDVDAMVDLAQRHYVLLMDTVQTKGFTIRKVVDNFLHWLMPNKWVPLYTAVSFTTLPYKKCVDGRAWQDKMIKRVLSFGATALTVGGAAVAYQLMNGCSETSIIADTMDSIKTSIGS